MLMGVYSMLCHAGEGLKRNIYYASELCKQSGPRTSGGMTPRMWTLVVEVSNAALDSALR